MNDTEKNDQKVSTIKKIKRKTLVVFLGVLLIITIGIGGKIYMDNKRFHDEMENVVKSGQTKKIIEDELRGLDSKALTSDGIIKSYEIEYKSIEHNPMGSIMFDVIINKDNDLVLSYSLNKRSGILKNGGLILSEKLSDDLESY